MLSHVCVGTGDLARAEAFYAPIMALLGWRLRFSEAGTGWAGWQPRDADRPLFIVGRPYNGEAAQAGNGGMVALLAADRPMVDAVFAAAMQGGGRNEGEPGPRPHYHAAYYGAYFRDLDGNKLCVCCHAAPG